jgi:hypothetical protein
MASWSLECEHYKLAGKAIESSLVGKVLSLEKGLFE